MDTAPTSPGGPSSYRTDAKGLAYTNRRRSRRRTGSPDSHPHPPPGAGSTLDPAPDRRATSAAAPGIDLRRHWSRAIADHLLRLAEFLPAADRAVLRAVLIDNQSLADYARQTGGAAAEARRRFRRLILRMRDPAFEQVCALRDGWPARMNAVATLCILHGLTINQAAARLRLGRATVRSQRDAVRAILASRTPHAPARRLPAAGERR